MSSMEGKLHEAAIAGNVSMLLELIKQDPLLLDRFNLTHFTETTPLHVASLLGHLNFVKLILQRKPKLAEELDSRRSSPLHLAAVKGHLEIVRCLLQINAEMCFVCNEDGRNPLHLAAMKGQVKVLAELIKSRPSAAARICVDYGGGTILHLCVKNNQIEALKMLIKATEDEEFVNVKDAYGFTILHLAVSNKLIEIVKYLVSNTRIEVNAMNSNGFTALDILAQSQRDIKDFDIGELLRAAGASRVTNNDAVDTENNENETTSLQLNCKNFLSKIFGSHCLDKDWLSKKREALMVVASLIATMAFQAGVNPPGGLWQEDHSPHPQAGKSIMASKDMKKYSRYLSFNTIGFTASIGIILILVTGLPFRLKHHYFMWFLIIAMWIALTFMGLTYATAIGFFTPESSQPLVFRIYFYGSFVIACFGGVLLVGTILELFSIPLKKMYGKLLKKRQQHQIP